jgi:hypothetical protein
LGPETGVRGLTENPVGESVALESHTIITLCEDLMLTPGAAFAKYSKILCWGVSFILLLLALLSFTSETDNGMIVGFLWLAGAFAFAISAIYLSKSPQSEGDTGSSE